MRFMVSLIVGMFAGGFFISAFGGLNTFWNITERVSLLHYWYGLLLIVAVFWIGFLGTWVAYSILQWGVNRSFYGPRDQNLDEW